MVPLDILEIFGDNEYNKNFVRELCSEFGMTLNTTSTKKRSFYRNMNKWINNERAAIIENRRDNLIEKLRKKVNNKKIENL
jgi:hypothetical protein